MYLRVLELYSGIGGMHYALNASNIPDIKVVAAVDISPLTTAVYCHNFPTTAHFEKGIEGFRSFLHLLKILVQMETPPVYILLENVKGFEESKAYSRFIDVLNLRSYSYQGFLVSPKHLGVPNSRLRYYLLAKRKPLTFNKNWFQADRILDFLPPLPEAKLKVECKVVTKMKPDQCEANLMGNKPCPSLERYLEPTCSVLSDYKIPKVVAHRYFSVMDIVNAASTSSTCFTKSYGQYVEGTGSIINIAGSINTETSSENETKQANDHDLRYFTPREIANLLGFPKDKFTFPENTTTKQKYRLLGNSLNVDIVAYLLNLLVSSDNENM